MLNQSQRLKRQKKPIDEREVRRDLNVLKMDPKDVMAKYGISLGKLRRINCGPVYLNGRGRSKGIEHYIC